MLIYILYLGTIKVGFKQTLDASHIDSAFICQMQKDPMSNNLHIYTF